MDIRKLYVFITNKQLLWLCKHITEFGTRHGDSTSALFAADPDTFISYDLYRDEEVVNFYAPYKNFTFIQGDTLQIEIEPTDLLFIDTLHTYFQLFSELTIHSKKVSRFIILHDTVSYGHEDESSYSPSAPVKMSDIVRQGDKKGLKNALNDFLQTSDGKNWIVREEFTNNNGLVVLERKNIDITST
jgi:hypothetical protein